jgi:hypothetical protein
MLPGKNPAAFFLHFGPDLHRRKKSGGDFPAIFIYFWAQLPPRGTSDTLAILPPRSDRIPTTTPTKWQDPHYHPHEAFDFSDFDCLELMDFGQSDFVFTFGFGIGYCCDSCDVDGGLILFLDVVDGSV